MASGVSFEWDTSEEKARERRIAERRERVQQQRERAGAGGAAPPPPPAPQLSKGQAAAAEGAEAVHTAHEAAAAEVEAVRRSAEERTDAHREACDAEEAALREQVAAEAEASRHECRAIDLEWERLQGVTAPQALAAGLAAAAQRCAGVLASKEGVLGAARALLARRDDQYLRLLRAQGEESDALIAAMHAQHAACKVAQEAALEGIEAAYLQERAEQAAGRKAELEALLEQRSAMEQEFMDQYLAACEACEGELEGLRAAGAQQHADLKRRLEGEVAALEAHLDGLRASTGLAADRLDYSYRVLVEREKESKEALLHQKRRITRQWEVLARLKKRYAAADARAAADNARLSDEYTAVARAFAHLQRKVRHFEAADVARFEQVRAMKDAELEELLGDLLEAQALIAAFAAGTPLAPSAADAAATADASKGVAGTASGGAEGGGPDLAVVGTALPAGALAAAGAAQAAAFGPGEAPAEVVAVPGGQGAQLIPAYRPAAAEQEAQPSEAATSAAASIGMDGLAVAPEPEAHEAGVGPGRASDSPGAAQPTSRRYWQARADAALPPGVARAWQLVERQAGQQLATLQARAGAADEVLALRTENEQLKATLAELFSSPLSKGPGALQLPPALLLK